MPIAKQCAMLNEKKSELLLNAKTNSMIISSFKYPGMTSVASFLPDQGTGHSLD